MKNLSFSTDGTTTSMKERQTPANPKSPKQSANRVYFSLSSKGYGKLSAANVALWKAYAAGLTFVGKKTKTPYTPNAYEAYKALTQVWYAANDGVGTPPTAPPTTPYAGEAAMLTASASGGAVSFTSSTTSSASSVAEVWLQPLKNPNRKPSSSGYRIAGYLDFSTPPPSISVAVAPGVYAARYCWIDKATGERTALVDIPVVGVALALSDGGADEAEKAPARAKKAA